MCAAGGAPPLPGVRGGRGDRSGRASVVRVLNVRGLSEGREAGKSEERKEREGHHRELIPREEIVKRYGDRRERERGSGQAFVKLESFSGGGQSVGICAPSDSGSTATVPASRDARSLGEVLALGSTGVMTPTRNNNYPVVDSNPVERNARGPSFWGERSVKGGTLSSGAECKSGYLISAWGRSFVPILVGMVKINK